MNVDGNPCLRKDSVGCLILLDVKGRLDRHLVNKNGYRHPFLNESLYLKDAGLTLTEDTDDGVLEIDCIPEPWKSKVIKYEKDKG